MKRKLGLPIVALLVLAAAVPLACAAELIAVAADTNQASSLVGWNAAGSPYYLLFAVTGELLDVLENPYRGQGRGAGASAVEFLARKGVTIIVAQHFGPGMIQLMEARGIKAVQFRGIARAAVTRIQPLLEQKETPVKGDTNEGSP